jgi:hypothetical protein
MARRRSGSGRGRGSARVSGAETSRVPPKSNGRNAGSPDGVAAVLRHRPAWLDGRGARADRRRSHGLARAAQGTRRSHRRHDTDHVVVGLRPVLHRATRADPRHARHSLADTGDSRSCRAERSFGRLHDRSARGRRGGLYAAASISSAALSAIVRTRAIMSSYVVLGSSGEPVDSFTSAV